MQLRKSLWNHIGIRHRVHRTASAYHKRVPARNDSAKPADDNHIGHCLGSICFSHRIRCYQPCTLHRCTDLRRIHQVSNRNYNQRVERYRHNYRHDQYLAYLFERPLNLLRCLRNYVESYEEERCHNRYVHHVADGRLISSSRKKLWHQVAYISAYCRRYDEQNAYAKYYSRQNSLHYRSRLGTEYVDKRHKRSRSNRKGKPRCIDVKPGNRIQISLQEPWKYIRHDRRKRASLEAHNSDVTEDNPPGTYE